MTSLRSTRGDSGILNLTLVAFSSAPLPEERGVDDADDEKAGGVLNGVGSSANRSWTGVLNGVSGTYRLL